MQDRQYSSENGLKVPAFAAGRVVVPVLHVSVWTRAERIYGRVVALGFAMGKPPAIVALLAGGRGVGSFDDNVAPEDWDLGKLGHELPVFILNLY